MEKRYGVEVEPSSCIAPSVTPGAFAAKNEGASIDKINLEAMYKKYTEAGGSLLLSSLQQYGCEGAVGKAVEAAIASNCTQSETRASLCFAVLEALLAHIDQGGVAVATKSSYVSDSDLLLLCRWKLSVDLPFKIPRSKVSATSWRARSSSGCGCITHEMKTLIVRPPYICTSSTTSAAFHAC